MGSCGSRARTSCASWPVPRTSWGEAGGGSRRGCAAPALHEAPWLAGWLLGWLAGWLACVCLEAALLQGATDKLGPCRPSRRLRVHGLIVGSPEKKRADPAVLRGLCSHTLPSGKNEVGGRCGARKPARPHLSDTPTCLRACTWATPLPGAGLPRSKRSVTSSPLCDCSGAWQPLSWLLALHCCVGAFNDCSCTHRGPAAGLCLPYSHAPSPRPAHPCAAPSRRQVLIHEFESWAGVQQDRSMQFDWDDALGNAARREAGLRLEKMRQARGGRGRGANGRRVACWRKLSAWSGSTCRRPPWPFFC